MDRLQFWLLGSLQIWRGEVRLDSALTSARLKTLLCLLLTHRNRYVAAEQLVEELWPDYPPRRAANNLQVAVSQLRRWLEPSLQRGGDSRFLLTEEEGYRFQSAGCYIDADDFLEAVQVGSLALRSDDLSLARDSLERARELHRGDYLADFPYAEWALSPRETVREAHLQGLVSLVETYLRLGHVEEAIGVAQQGLRVDSLREVFYRQSMRAHNARGRRAEALAVYERCRTLLAEVWGVQPAAETQALREAILQGTEDATPVAAGAGLTPSLELPFVGREEPLARLRRAWDENVQLVLVAGEAGLGKTRLLQEFAAALGVPALWGSAHPEDPPFAAAIDCFRAYLRLRPPRSQLETLGPAGGPLAEAAPMLRDLWPACPRAMPLAPEEERQRLHHALLAGLRLAATGPSLLILDDLHWAGADALGVLRDLLRRMDPESVLVVSYRREELTANEALATWLSTVRREQEPTEIMLSYLTEADVLQAVRTITGSPDVLRFSQRLAHVTGGHPLFLVETVRALVDSGHLYRDSRGNWRTGELIDEEGLVNLALSEDLREAILSRARQLNPLEREVLDAAAVLQQQATLPALAKVLHVESAGVEEALRTLVGRRLLQAGDGGWRLAHQLIRETLYAALPQPQRRLLHRLAADALIDLYPAQPHVAAAEIVHHLHEGSGGAASGSRGEALARWAMHAAQWAYQNFAHARARDFYELVLEQLRRLPPGDRPAELELKAREGLGRAQRLTGQARAGLTSLESALPFARALEDRVRLLLAMTRIYATDTGEYERALALLAHVESILREGEVEEKGALMGEVLARRAGILFWSGKYQEGAETAQEAVVVAAGTSAERAALQSLGTNLHKLGRVEEAATIHRRLLALAQESGDLRHLSEAYNLVGMSQTALGMLRETLDTFEAARRLDIEMGNLRGQSIRETNIGSAAVDLGDLARAEEAQRQAIILAEEVGAPYTVAHARFHLGHVLALRGRWQEAGEQFERALAEAREIEAHVVEAQTQAYYGRYYFWPRAEHGEARARAQAALNLGEKLGDNFCRRESRILLALLELEAGDAAAAERYAEEAWHIAREARQRLSTGRAQRALGQIAGARGELGETEKYFGAAERIFRETGATLELGETWLEWAAAGHRAGAWGEHRPRWLREARRTFRAATALPLLRRTQELLAATGA